MLPMNTRPFGARNSGFCQPVLSLDNEKHTDCPIDSSTRRLQAPAIRMIPVLIIWKRNPTWLSRSNGVMRRNECYDFLGIAALYASEGLLNGIAAT